MTTTAPNAHAAAIQRGLARHRAGDLAGATETYLQVLSETPDHVDALHYSGLAAYQSGQHEDAALLLGRAVELRPRAAEAHNVLGLALRALGRPAEALAAFRAAIAARPKLAWAHNNLGVTLKESGDAAGAQRAYEAALRIEPEHADALGNLGILLKERGELARAEQLLRRAIGIAPASASHHSNLGATLRAARRLGDAEASARRAIALDPALAESHYNLGTILADDNRLGEAAAAFDAAIARRPDFGVARWNRSLVLLALGRYAEAWSDYRWHPGAAQALPGLLSMAPLPQALDGLRVLLYRNQGLGDELFFLRFAPALRARGARVAYHGDARLVSLVERAGCADSVEACDDTARVPAGTLVVPVDHLPHLLGHGDAARFPPALRIAPAPVALETARRALSAAGPGPWLAVTWQAGTTAAADAQCRPHAGRLYKSVPPEALGRALARWPGTIVSVQRLPQAADARAFERGAGRAVADLGAFNADLEAMLALLASIDEYVAVSNTNVHLRAAAGRETRVLVPFPPEWRWGQSGTSPWFPGAQVLRQAADGDWSAALDALARLQPAPDTGN